MAIISDIAKDMNLSEATISNALTGGGRMKAETRAAIIKRADELGYVPTGRSRRKAKKNVIVIAEDIRVPFVAQILEGVRAEAAKHEIYLPIYNLGLRTNRDLQNPDINVVNKVIERLVDSVGFPISGIIYVAQYPRLIEGLMAGISIPTVCALCTREDGVPYVHYDDHQGAYLAVKNLIDGGRRHIAMISGPINSIAMIHRTSGYQRALIDHGISFDPSLMRIGDWTTASGYKITQRLLEENRDIDSIFAQNDSMAIGALHAIAEKGLRIPEDASVIGFDNTSSCRRSMPQLSSIAPGFEDMGCMAYQMVMKLMKKNISSVESVIIPCTLIHRNTTFSP